MIGEKAADVIAADAGPPTAAPAARPAPDPAEVSTMRRTSALTGFAAAAVLLASCQSAAPPPIRFAPAGTDLARLRSEFALTDAERAALTPESIKHLDQAQVDQIYLRLDTGPMPDGPFRGDLFFPRGSKRDIRLGELTGVPRDTLAELAVLRLETLGKALWRGKVFFRSQGVLRNRIEELSVLKPFVRDWQSIPKLTFDGARRRGCSSRPSCRAATAASMRPTSRS